MQNLNHVLLRQHEALKRARKEIERLSEAADAPFAPIAIVGIACRVPGAESPEALWALLERGGEAVGEVPAGRWDQASYHDSEPGTPGKTYSSRAGYLPDADLFDARFFGISPREAQQLDPQQRLLMEVSYEAFEHAGIPTDQLAGTAGGVFVGVSSSEYGVLTFARDRGVSQDAYSVTGTSTNAAAGRLSFFYGMTGPAMAIDTACSSSLVAIHQACRSLAASECRIALAGGVNRLLTPEPTIALAQNKVLSSSGRCSPFSDDADGLVRGEGAGLLVLMRIDDAVAEGRRVLAVIRGGHVNQDGASSGLTVPNGLAQEALICEAMRRARVQPHDIAYVEAHGTGTPLGDPIEIEAMSRSLCRGRDVPLPIGSIKANIGHLEAASGVAGVIKLVLALQHRKLPAQINVRVLSSHVDWSRAGLRPCTGVTAIDYGPDKPFFAGVSSFGFSGTNAHLVLQDAESACAPLSPPPGSLVRSPVLGRWFVGLSAKDPEALQRLCRAYVEQGVASEPWPWVASAINSRRAHHRCRRGVVAEDGVDFLRQLTEPFDGSKESLVLAPIVFGFGGQGGQYGGMGNRLAQAEPAFLAALEDCDAALAPHLGRSIIPVIRGEAEDLNATRWTQPAIFCLEYALARLLAARGIVPDFVIGHSIGEYAAAVVAGVFSLEDAARMIAHRGRLMEELCRPGKMLAVLASRQEAEALMAGLDGEIALAAANGPQSQVLSGETRTIDEVAARAAERGLRNVSLAVSHAFHSPMMDPMLAVYREVVAQTVFSKPITTFVSTALGRPVSTELVDPEYWVAHVREPVEFERAVRSLFEQRRGDMGTGIFVEVSPQEQMIRMARGIVSVPAIQWRPMLKPGDDLGAWANCQKMLYDAGAKLRFDASASAVVLPTYPFDRRSYWMPDYECGTGKPCGRGEPISAELTPDADGSLYRILWEEAGVLVGLAPSPNAWLVIGPGSKRASEVEALLRGDGKVVLSAAAGDIRPDHPVDRILWFAAPLDPAAPIGDVVWRLLQDLRRCAVQLRAGARFYCILPVQAASYSPDHAALAGLCRSIGREDGDLAVRVLGIDSGAPADGAARWIVAEACGEGAPEIRYREGRREHPRLRAYAAQAGAVSLRRDRTYLVTGATGAVGRALAQGLISGGAGEIVLVSRRASAMPVPALDIAAAAAGARLSYIDADVSCELDMVELFDRLARDYAPLAGIVHAAGLISDAAFENLSRKQVDIVLGAKVGGARLLDRLTRGHKLDFMVFVSSVAATLGAPGQAPYAAANAYLDALADMRRVQGLSGLSLALGPVADAGMAAAEKAAQQSSRAGLLPISHSELCAIAERFACASPPHLLLARFDWERVGERVTVAKAPLLEAFLARPGPSSSTAPATVDALAVVRDCIARVLGAVESYEIRESDTLSELGMDSITMVELRDALARALGFVVPANVLFDFPQVGKLARHLAGRACALSSAADGLAKLREGPDGQGDGGAIAIAIAIVGIGCRLPGGIESPEGLWAALERGDDLVGCIDPMRWDAATLLRDAHLATDRAGVIDGIDLFDGEPFGISPREAQCMDPQQRLLLEVSWEALERGGYDFTDSSVRGGVFVGAGPNDYSRRFDQAPHALSHHLSTGNAISVAAGRISYSLDWTGPAIVVDTACSSSLMAVHLAARALAAGECDIALAGGVNLLLSPETSLILSKGEILARDGRCKTFDACADGYVRSEGCAMVVLKRLDDAMRDVDEIIAVVRGSATNQDGHSQGLTAPNGQAQQQVLRAALAAAAVRPEQVELLEAHGTGTPLGDPIELAAVRAVYAAPDARVTPLWVSSIKTNIGHTEAAAGIAGLLKAALCIQKAAIVPHLHFHALNPEIEADSALRIPTEKRPWDRLGPRFAAVSSFGFSGTNVHLILESRPSPKHEAAAEIVPLLISGATHEALREGLVRYRDALLMRPDLFSGWSQLSWRRARFTAAIAISASTGEEAVAKIDDLLQDETRLAQALAVGLSSVPPRLAATPAGAALAPTYPFQRRRYWIDPPQLDVRTGRPWFRLGDREGQEVVYAVDFADSVPYRLADHIVHAAPVVPAAAHLALAAGMLRDLSGAPAGEICDILCEEALVATPDMAAVRYLFARETASTSTGGAEWRLRVVSDESGRERRHLQALVRPLASAEVLGIDAPTTFEIGRFDARRFYDELYNPEIRLGGCFRGVTVIVQHVGAASATLDLRGAPNGLPFGPGGLDSALQTIALATLCEEAGRSDMQGATIPVAIERIAFAGDAAAEGAALCHTRLRHQDSRGGFTHDISVNAGARFSLSVEGLITRRIDSKRLLRSHGGALPMLTEEWVEVERQSPQAVGRFKRILRLIGDGCADSARFQLTIERAGFSVENLSIDELASPMAKGPADILFKVGSDDEAAHDLFTERALVLTQALQRFAAVRREAGSVESSFTIVFEHAADITAGDTPSPLLGWTLGLVKSLQLEDKEANVRILDLQGDADDTAILSAELTDDAGEPFVAYRHGRRFCLRVNEVRLPVESGERAGFAPSKDGVYVVTGGLGALAAETCGWLASLGVRRLALIGRSRLQAATVAQLTALRAALEAEVDLTYHAVDVGDAPALAKVFTEIVDVAPVRGIVHAAGVLADGLFSQLERADFEIVMRAKVAGSWNLHLLSMSMKLDCFILYSSLAALFGAAGQSNYAAANGFMDYLARHRTRLGLPALSVNWGAWSGAGMAQRQGAGSVDGAILPLTPELAVAGMDAALGSRRSQLAVAYIDRAAFARRITDDTPPLVADWLGGVARQAAAQPALVAAVLAAPQSSQAEIVQKKLINCARAIMSLAGDVVIDEHRLFQDMGFDSLMSIELKVELEKTYSIKVPSTLVFDYPNLITLSHFVLETIRHRWGGKVTTVHSDVIKDISKVKTSDSAALDVMNTKELAELLRQLL